jgi:hypothetical protein
MGTFHRITEVSYIQEVSPRDREKTVELAWWFLAIETCRGAWVPVLDDSGRPLFYKSEPLMPQYLKMIGLNMTGELFHPDEILAQNFVLVVNQPSLGLLTEMRSILAP